MAWARVSYVGWMVIEGLGFWVREEGYRDRGRGCGGSRDRKERELGREGMVMIEFKREREMEWLSFDKTKLEHDKLQQDQDKKKRGMEC